MPNLALPSTSEFPPDPSSLARRDLDALYLELRSNYASLMRSRGQYRRLSAEHKDLLTEQSLEQWQQKEELQTVLAREARLKAETYALLEQVTALIETLEDAGDELSTSFGSFQLSKRRAGSGFSAGGALASIGGGLPQLMKGVLHFLNRWRQGKQQFQQLLARRQELKDLLDSDDEGLESPERFLAELIDPEHAEESGSEHSVSDHN